MKARLLVVLVVAGLSVSLPAFAEPDSDGILDKQEASCQTNINYLRGKIDQIVLWSSIFLVAGAIASGVGSGLAGFLGKAGQRKVAGVVGALGAVITILAKVVPDKTVLEGKLAAADKHHTVGAKFRNQFAFAQPFESLTDAEKYVSARFTDCAALDPSPNVPDFPRDSPSVGKLEIMPKVKVADAMAGFEPIQGSVSIVPQAPQFNEAKANDRNLDRDGGGLTEKNPRFQPDLGH